MKVKEMMQWLSQFDEEAEVSVEIKEEGEIWVEGYGSQWVRVEVEDEKLDFRDDESEDWEEPDLEMGYDPYMGCYSDDC
jgi:hypothetical protein